MRKFLLLAALGAGLPASLPGQEATAVMERAARTYQALTSFSADFLQVIDDAMLGTYRSRGKLVQSGDAKLSMRFSDPDGEAIIVDGTHAWVYTPSTAPGQVLKLSVSQLPDFYNLSRLLDRPAERYQVRGLRREAINGRMADVVVVAPRDSVYPFTEATIWLDREDALPRRLQFRERGGAIRTLTFSLVRTNDRVPGRTFSFEVPAGVRVVDQM